MRNAIGVALFRYDALIIIYHNNNVMIRIHSINGIQAIGDEKRLMQRGKSQT